MSCTQTDGSKGCSKVLTIAIPSYNVERYLEHGLASYCSPKLESGLEVIVVDDGSTDATALIAESFVRRSPSIFKVISKENGGHGSTINAALQQARGKYFRVVDGDDWVCTQGLIYLVERLVALTAFGCRQEARGPHGDGGEHAVELPDGIIPGDVLSFSSVCGVHQAASQIMIHTLTAKTSYLRSTGLHLLEHTFYEDYEYILKAEPLPRADIVFYDIEVYQYLGGQRPAKASF